jgi:hypothetical protein
MSVRVFDNDGRIVGIKPVPISLASKEKIASILLKTDINDVDPQVDNYLPRISINWAGITWVPERMRGKFEKRLMNIEYLDATTGQRRSIQTDVQPTPYDLSFEVTVWAKYDIDMKQLIENILPFFAPEIYVSIKERNFGIERKCKVIHNSTTFNNTIELKEEDRRVLLTNMAFTMQAVLYQPMNLSKEILCSIISISDVPCKRIPFQGEKIIAADSSDATPEAIEDRIISLSIRDLDAGEKYDLMVNRWRFANNVMNPPSFSGCVSDNCQEPIPPRPGWDLNSDGTIDPEQPSPCTLLPRKPIVFVDSTTQQITIYYQEVQEVIDSPTQGARIIIVSYYKKLSPTGDIIEGPTVIPNDDYPDAPTNLPHLQD